MEVTSFAKPENVVLIRRADPGAPARNILLVHDGTGRIEGYFEAARHLRRDLNVFGVLPDSPERGDAFAAPRHFSLGAQAGAYARAVKGWLGGSPILLAGWSAGGAIAFEMARALRLASEDVRFLALVDTAPPRARPTSSSFTAETERELLLPFVTDTAVRERLARCADAASFWERVRAEVSARELDLDAFMRSGDPAWGKMVPHHERLPLAGLLAIVNAIRSHHRAGLEYVPAGELDLPVHYFRARDSVVTGHSEWGRHCRAFITHDVPGEHYTMLSGSHGREFAAALGAALDAVA